MIAALVTALCVAAGPGSAQGPVSVQYDGPLKQGLTLIAERGGLNLIVVGELSDPAQIHLTELDAAEALETVAKVYGLEVTREGKLYVLRKTGTVAVAAPPTPPVALVQPTPPTPPTPPEPLDTQLDKLDAQREKIETLIEEGREKHEEVHPGPVLVRSGNTVKDAVSFGGTVTIESGAHVTNDAVAFGGDVVLKDGAIVDGDAVAFGGRVRREGAATVKGEEVSFGGAGLASAMANHANRPVAEDAEEKTENEVVSHGMSLASFLVNFVVFFVVGFLFMVFAPQRMKRLESALRAQPIASGAVGMLALMALLPITLFLVITLIGIPIAGLVWALIALAIPMGLAALANTLGTAMPLGRVRRTQALVLAIGVFALLLVAQVPVVGPLILSLAICVSLGAVLRTRLGAPPKGLPVTESVEQLSV